MNAKILLIGSLSIDMMVRKMRNLLLHGLMCLVLLAFSSGAQAGNKLWVGGSGNNWSTALNWSPAGVPGATDDVSINGNQNITLDVDAAISFFTITASTGTVTITSTGAARTLTINNASTIVSGSLTFQGVVAGTLTILCTNGNISSPGASSLFFGSSATYQHGFDGGTIPAATWGPASTCLVTGMSATAPLGLDQNFGNLTWNCTIQAANVALTALFSIQGNLSIISTGAGANTFSFSDDKVNVIGGNYSQTGGIVNLGLSGTHSLTVGGSFTLSTGTFNNLGDNTPGGVLNIAGSYSHTSGTLNGGSLLNIVFNGTTEQVFASGGSLIGNINYTVNDLAILQMDQPTTVMTGASFTLAAGGTLGIRNQLGLVTTPTSHIQTASRTYTPGAHYIYNGIANQVTGNELAINSPANITINNPTKTVTLSATTPRTGTLTVHAGSTFALTTFNLTGTGGPTSGIGGIALDCGATAPSLISATTGVLNLGGNVIVSDVTGAGTQGATISAPVVLTGGGGSHIFSVPDDGSAANDLMLNNTVTGSQDVTKTGAGTLNFGGNNVSLGSLTISAGTLISTSGILYLTGNFANNSASTTTFNGNGGTVEMNGGAAQAISGTAATLFNSLTLTTSGTKTFPANMTIDSELNIGGTAVASIAAGDTITSNSLVLGGISKAFGTWGSSSSTATHKNNVYFAATTGILIVSIGGTVPVISGVTASQSIVYGAPSITLSGTVSTAGPVVKYPVAGEVVSVTINGSTQSATVSGTVGVFSISYNTPTIPYSATPYSIVYSYAGNEVLNAAVNEASTTLTVNKKTASVTASNQTKVYGTVFTFLGSEFTTTGFINSDAVTSVTLASTGTPVTARVAAPGPTYPIVPGLAVGTGLDNYTITYLSTGLLTVTPAPLTVTAKDLQKTYGDYLNIPVTEFLTPSGLFNGDVVSSVTLTSTGSAATATVAGSPYPIVPSAASGIGLTNYTLAYANGAMTIVTRNITIAADAKSKFYGQLDPPLTHQITSGSIANGDTPTGALSRVAGEAVGPYVISINTLTYGPNYNETHVGAILTINPLAITVTANSGQTKIYGSADPVFTFTVSPPLLNNDAPTGALSRTGGENVFGSPYPINIGTLSFGLNYAVTFVSAGFTITPKTVTVTPTNYMNKTYGDPDPVITYTYSPALLPGNSFSGRLGRRAGESVDGSPYEVNLGTLSAGPNYVIHLLAANFYIYKKTITVFAAPLQFKVYGAPDPYLGYASTPVLLAGDSFTGEMTRAPGENIGLYAILPGTLSAGSNYVINFVSANFEIRVRPITITVTPGQSKAYGAADPALLYTISPGMAFNDQLTGLMVRAAGETVAGSPYPITQGTLAATSNYAITFIPGNFTIVPRGVTITVTPGQSKVYGEADPVFAFTYSPELVGTETLVGALTRLGGVHVGQYPIAIGTLAAGNNYAVTFVPANFTITAKPITVTASTTSKVYDRNNTSAGVPKISPELIAGDTPSFTQFYDDKKAGNLKTLMPTGTVVDGNNGNNYVIFFEPVYNGVISQLAIVGRITAEDKEYDGKTNAVILIRSLSGVLPGDIVSYVGGTATFDTPDVGSNKTVTATGLSLSGIDAPNYSVNTTATATARITGIIKVIPSITVTPGLVQYSDRVTLTATVTGGAPVGEGVVAAKSVTFSIGGQVMKDALNNSNILMTKAGANLVASLTVSLRETTMVGSMSPGNKAVTATFNEPDINFSFTPRVASTTLNIVQEDASATYTGDYLVTAPAGGSASVVLRASVNDISGETGGDGLPGDIRNASVSFVNRSTGTVLGTVPVTLVNPADSKVGKAVFYWNGVPQGDYVIGMVVNNYYTCNVTASNAVVQVYEPSGDFLTGGGYVIPTLSSGKYESDAGKRTSFGFDVRIDEFGSVSQARATILLVRTVAGVPRNYKIRCSNLTSISVDIKDIKQLTGSFIGSAVITDITDPALPVEMGAGLVLRVKLTDRGIPGTLDDISFTLMNGTSLYYSSNLVSGLTNQLNLTGGNLIVRSTVNLNEDVTTGIGDITDAGSPIRIVAYPNPSPGILNFSFKVDLSTRVTLDLLSVNGSVISRIFEGYADQNAETTVTYDSKLPQGVYYYRLQTSDRVLFGKLVIAGGY
jgi:hypothetical protein